MAFNLSQVTAFLENDFISLNPLFATGRVFSGHGIILTLPIIAVYNEKNLLEIAPKCYSFGGGLGCLVFDRLKSGFGKANVPANDSEQPCRNVQQVKKSISIVAQEKSE